MSNPFRYFNSSPEVIRLVVMMYVKYPLSVEDLLAERGIDLAKDWENLNFTALMFLRFASIRLMLRKLCNPS